MSSEKSSSAVDVKDLPLKDFDMISILSNASVTLSYLRRTNVKHTLNKDVQGVCDPTCQISQHSFGDESYIFIEENVMWLPQGFQVAIMGRRMPENLLQLVVNRSLFWIGLTSLGLIIGYENHFRNRCKKFHCILTISA